MTDPSIALSITGSGCLVIAAALARWRNQTLMGAYIKAVYWFARRLAAYAHGVEDGYRAYRVALTVTDLRPDPVTVKREAAERELAG